MCKTAAKAGLTQSLFERLGMLDGWLMSLLCRATWLGRVELVRDQ